MLDFFLFFYILPFYKIWDRQKDKVYWGSWNFISNINFVFACERVYDPHLIFKELITIQEIFIRITAIINVHWMYEENLLEYHWRLQSGSVTSLYELKEVKFLFMTEQNKLIMSIYNTYTSMPDSQRHISAVKLLENCIINN